MFVFVYNDVFSLIRPIIKLWLNNPVYIISWRIVITLSESEKEMIRTTHTMLMIINVIIKHHKNTTNSRVLHDTESKSSFFVLLSKNIIIKRCLLSYEFLFWALAPVSAYSSVLNMAFFLVMHAWWSMLFLGYSFGQRHYRLSLSFLFVLSSQVNISRSSYRDAAIESTTIHSATSLQRNRFLSSLLLIFFDSLQM